MALEEFSLIESPRQWAVLLKIEIAVRLNGLVNGRDTVSLNIAIMQISTQPRHIEWTQSDSHVYDTYSLIRFILLLSNPTQAIHPRNVGKMPQ